MIDSTGNRPPCLLVAEEVWGSPLHTARSLATIGARPLVAVAGEGAAILGASKYCAAAVDLDPADPGAFCRELVAWAESHVPDDVPVPTIPLSDRLVAFLDTHRDQFPERFRLAIAPHEVNAVLLDKAAALGVAAAAGLEIAPWAHVRRVEDLALVSALRPPLIVRPTSWATAGSASFKFRVLAEAEVDAELRAALARGAELLVQEYLEVAESAVEFALTWRSIDGTSTATCTGRKRRAAEPCGGVMAWGEAVDLADVRDAALRFLDRSGHVGPGGIELIRHEGRLSFVEFNPRLEATHFLGSTAGVDIVRLTYEDLATGQRPGRAGAAAPGRGLGRDRVAQSGPHRPGHAQAAARRSPRLRPRAEQCAGGVVHVRPRARAGSHPPDRTSDRASRAIGHAVKCRSSGAEGDRAAR